MRPIFISISSIFPGEQLVAIKVVYKYNPEKYVWNSSVVQHNLCLPLQFIQPCLLWILGVGMIFFPLNVYFWNNLLCFSLRFEDNKLVLFLHKAQPRSWAPELDQKRAWNGSRWRWSELKTLLMYSIHSVSNCTRSCITISWCTDTHPAGSTLWIPCSQIFQLSSERTSMCCHYKIERWDKFSSTGEVIIFNDIGNCPSSGSSLCFGCS